MKKILFISILILFLMAKSQAKVPYHLIKKIQELDSLMQIQKTLSFSIETYNGIHILTIVNEKITVRLINLLKDRGSLDESVISKLSGIGFSNAISKDKKLRIFTWFENTGGSFQSNLSIVKYLTSTGILGAYHLKEKDCASYGYFAEPIKLKGTKKNLYVSTGGATTCNTCIASYAVVFQITEKYLIINYPAFENNSACLTLGSRIGTHSLLEFDPIKQEMKIEYGQDDYTSSNPFIDKKNKDGEVSVILKFNGEKFILKN